MEKQDNFIIQRISRPRFLDYFIAGLLIATVLAILAGFVFFIHPPNPRRWGSSELVQVAAQSELPVGKERLAFYRGKNVLVVHAKNGFVGFSAIDGAPLKWDERKEQIICPTDGSIFDTKGNKVSGRAEYPLQAYQVKASGERVYLTGPLFLKESKEYARNEVERRSGSSE